MFTINITIIYKLKSLGFFPKSGKYFDHKQKIAIFDFEKSPREQS